VHSSGFGAATTGSGPIRLRAAPATLPLVELVARLNALQAPALMGYPTKLAQLAAEQRAGRLHIRPRMVTTTSELLTAEDRAAITTAFGAAVVDQFASTEGLVAHSEPGATLLTFATDMCLVEPVDETNRPVPPGEPAAKMLVTNLHNLTQPLIRYELTDRIVVDPHSDTAFMRASVDGRTDDVFRYGSVVIHPIAVRTVLVNTPAVTDYQARQTTSGVDLDIVTDRPVNARTLAQALERSLRNAGLPAAVVTVQTVPTIQRHPASGKGRRFVPLPAEQS
jgi:phenylacetate-coenzyme A ligase PaaK-like adenylate-forming protein